MNYQYMQYRMSKSKETEHTINIGDSSHPVTYETNKPHHHKFHLENVLNEISRPYDYNLGTPGNNSPYLIKELFPLHFSKQESSNIPEEDYTANHHIKQQLANRLADKYLAQADSPIIDKIADEFSHDTSKRDLGISGLHSLGNDPKTIVASAIHNLLDEHLKSYQHDFPGVAEEASMKQYRMLNPDAKELYRSLAEYFYKLKNAHIKETLF